MESVATDEGTITMQITDLTPVAEAAAYYQTLGLTPIAIHGTVSGVCQCSRGDECTAPGKHPVGKDWNARASSGEPFPADHTGNVGIALLGRWVLIDADGDEGLSTVDGFGELPETLTALSGSQSGGHWIFKLAPHQSADRITDRRVAAGVDVKIRGQFVCAPSMHASGHRYQWVNLCEPAELPDHLYELITSRPVPAATPAVSAAPDSRRVRAYVSRMDAAVSGQGGHSQTYAVACRIAAERLPDEEAWPILCEYIQRCSPPWSERDLRHKYEDAKRNATNAPLASRPRPALASVPANATQDDSWKQLCLFETTRNGEPRLARTAENAAIILQYDPAWRGRLKLDEFAQHISVTDPPWHEWQRSQVARKSWTDSDTTRLQGWLERAHGLRIAISDLERAITVAAERASYSSARDWFDGLQWDGTCRLGNWLSVYLGCEDTAYTRAVGRWWLISAVARVYKPGCKADHMLILHGEQGRGKSSAAAIIAGSDWFSDSFVAIGNKDAYLTLQGKLIVEMAELDSLDRSGANTIKSFLTSGSDYFRPPYARRNIDVPRQCVFIGTTNNHDMLRDDTGDRRFWPVSVGDIDRSGLTRDREQLWAEAVTEYKQGASWYPLTPDDRELCELAQSSHKQRHPWEELIERWADSAGMERASLDEIFRGALSMSAGQWKHGDIITLTGCLRRLQWEPRRDRQFDGEIRRYYIRSTGNSEDVTV